jgi:hypothetical protein
MPKGKEMMQAILEARERYIAAQNQVIKLAEEGKAAEAVATSEPIFDLRRDRVSQRVNALIKYQGE